MPYVLQCLLKQRKTLSPLNDPFVGDFDIFNLRPLYLADQRHGTVLCSVCQKFICLLLV